MSDDELEVLTRAARMGVGVDLIEELVFKRRLTERGFGVNTGHAAEFVRNPNYQPIEIDARSVDVGFDCGNISAADPAQHEVRGVI